MGFIAPWVLALLPLVALPILIHLAARRRRVVIDFPAVQAFREEVATHAHRSRLRDLWLLLIRVLAVVALVLGLAQPVLWAEPESGPKGRGDAEDRTVWLAMDVSASQRYRDSKGEGPWDRAIGVARRLAALAGDARPVGVVEFDAVGVRRRLRPSSSSAEVYAALALLEPGWQPLSLSAVRGVLGENPGPWIDEHGGRTPAASDRATTVVISDLRGVGWRALGAGGATMEARGVVRLVQTAEGSVPNRGVVDIEASVDDLDAAGNHLRVNLAGEGRGRADVEVDGESAGSFEVRLTGDEPTGFDVSVPLTGGEVIRVALDADGFEADDVRYALVPRPRDLRIRVVVGEAMSRGASGRVVGQMLDPNGDGRWHRVVEDHGTLESALEDPPPDVVVLADLVSIDRFEAERLVGFARAGGGVLTVLGARADLRAWDLAGARELTGCRVLGFEDVLRSVGEFNAAHPLLGAFSTADLASLARVEIERMVRLDCDGETVLGGEEPLLALRHLGGGGWRPSLRLWTWSGGSCHFGRLRCRFCIDWSIGWRGRATRPRRSRWGEITRGWTWARARRTCSSMALRPRPGGFPVGRGEFT